MATPQIGQYSMLAVDRLNDLALATMAAGSIPPSGTVYFVHSRGATTYDGKSRNQPLPTLALALAVSTAGDVILVLNGHTETLSTSGLTWSQSGVSVIGLGNKRNRPALTCGAADVVGITMSGNNNRLLNVRLIGSVSQTTTSSTILSLTGTDNEIGNDVFEHGGAGPLGCILLTAAHRTHLHDLQFLGTAAGPDFCIKTVGSATPSNDCVIERIRCQYVQSAGLDSAAIICHNTTGIPGWDMHEIRCIGMDVALMDINGSSIATTCDSLASRVYGAFTTATTRATAFDTGTTLILDSFFSDAVALPSPWIGVATVMATTPAFTLSQARGFTAGVAAAGTCAS